MAVATNAPHLDAVVQHRELQRYQAGGRSPVGGRHHAGATMTTVVTARRFALLFHLTPGEATVRSIGVLWVGLLALGLAATVADARGGGGRGGHGARTHYGGGHHTTSHGGSYLGGSGSSHKGGTYISPTGANQYGTHK